MLVASFLCKHLLIDWRWGEAYFAEKLFDYEQSSNVGNWQWSAGCGVDAAPYFRIFNPHEQIKKFDKNLSSISKVEEITKDKIIKKYDNQFKIIPKNVAKYFDEKILKLNNLNIVDLDHNELEFLQLKGLFDKDLIKPLYLS
jgi:deoxyribodipyrimidine photolyase